MKLKVVFVCLGNICRSPTAHGVFQSMVEAEGLQHAIMVDSAGTAAWHSGEEPHERTRARAARRGYNLNDLRGRQFIASDFQKFDYILAMDKSNLQRLESMRPDNYEGHLGLFLDFLSEEGARDERHGGEMPDPYHEGDEAFDYVIDLVEDASEGLMAAMKAKL